MRSIEETINISENGKDEHRQGLIRHIWSTQRRGKDFDYKSHPLLKEAIEKKLFASLKDVVKLTTSAKVPNEEQKERIQSVQNTLVEENGYCEHCAKELIDRASRALQKES
jgi:serine protein kinase